MDNDRHVVAIFDDRAKARRALDMLGANGFRQDQLSLLLSEDARNHHFEVDEDKSKTAEGAGYGAVLGGLLAGLGAVAAGVAAIAVPGSLLVTGPLGVALTSGAAGAAAGGLAGALIGMGLPDDEVQLVEGDLKDGSFLVAAHSIDSDAASTAKKIFKDCGAVRVH